MINKISQRLLYSRFLTNKTRDTLFSKLMSRGINNYLEANNGR